MAFLWERYVSVGLPGFLVVNGKDGGKGACIMHKTGGLILSALMVCMLTGFGHSAAEAGGENMAVSRMTFGVLWQECSSLFVENKYGGAAVQFWPSGSHAVQVGLALQTEREGNFSFHAEYQKHFRRRETDLYSFFTGGGLFFYDIPDYFDPFDDWFGHDISGNDNNGTLIGLYAPLGFQFKLRDYPISFSASTSVRLFVEPYTGGEFFEEVRLGIFYDF